MIYIIATILFFGGYFIYKAADFIVISGLNFITITKIFLGCRKLSGTPLALLICCFTAVNLA